MSWREDAKKRVASEAVKHVENGFVVGLGSGSTAAYVIAEIGQLIRKNGLQLLGVASSSQAYSVAIQSGVPLTTLDEHPVLDLDIDGADEVDRELNLIKGGGGALTREKVLASASKEVIIVADETKLVDKLGSTFKVPLEVLPFAMATATVAIERLGGNPLLRASKGKVGAAVTDNGNYLIDVDFGPIGNAKELNQQLKFIPGIVETGLFIGLTDRVYLGKKDGIVELKK